MKKLLGLLGLCVMISLPAFAAERVKNTGQDPAQSTSDFPHASKHQVRHTVTSDDCTVGCVENVDPDPTGTGSGCKTDRVCQITQSRCIFDVYSFCTTANARPGQPCEACNIP